MNRSGGVSVSVGQFEPAGDAIENIEMVRTLVERAVHSGAELVVFPELCLTGWGSDPESVKRLAIASDDPIIRRLVDITDQLNVGIIFGFYETSGTEDPRPYNTLVAVLPGSGIVAVHRKMHLFDAWGIHESSNVQPGDGQVAKFKMGDVTIGLVNCYEVRFPERSFELTVSGCDVLAVSASWARGPLKEEHWELNLRARALENSVWVVAASLTGPRVIGRSMVTDPLGVVRAQLDESSADCVTVFADTARIDDAQQSLPVRRQRHTFYHRRLESKGQDVVADRSRLPAKRNF